MSRKLSLFMFALIGIVVIASYSALAAPKPEVMSHDQIPRGGSISFADQRTPAGYDVHKIADSHLDVIMQNVIECLVYVHPTTHEIIPGLATKWDVTPDGKIYTFKLREDVTFHDGTPFDAYAVKKNYDRFSDPVIASPMFGRIFGTDYIGTEVIDKYTVQIEFGAPFSVFLINLNESAAGIVSSKTIDEHYEDIGDHIAGTGPFMVGEVVPKDRITLVRNENYHGNPPAFYKHQGNAYLDSVTYRHVTEESTRVAALQTGDLDVIRAPWMLVSSYDSAPGVYTEAVGNPGPPGRMDVTADRWPTDDVKVRQALQYYVNRDEMLMAPFYGGAIWAEDGPLTKGFWARSEKAASMYSYDPVKGDTVLREAGWEKNNAGVWQKDGKQLEILIVSEATPPFMTVSEIIAGQLGKAGIVVEIQSADTQAAWAMSRRGEANLTPFASTATDPDALYASYHSSGMGVAHMFTRIEIQELDDLLDLGRVTVDRDEREGIYLRAQEIIMEEALTIPLYNSARIYAVNQKVRGINFNNRAGMYMYDVYVVK